MSRRERSTARSGGRQRAAVPALRGVALATLLALGVHALPAAAQGAGPAGEREALESLRQTTLALIEALVQSGSLSRERADALIAEARQRGAAAAVAAAGPAGAQPAAAPAAGTTVRVPYVPQVVRDQIRNEVREEVIARARLERWGVPNATAEWTDRIAIEGDLRVRFQTDHAGSGNLSALAHVESAARTLTTRAPDYAAATSTGQPTGTPQDDRERWRLRARLGVNAKVNDWVTAGLRLATGSATDRVSTNQTLGQNFNRYAFLLDRAFVRLDPTPWASLSAGRFANPWFSTDLVWSENLNFEGLAANFKWPASPNATVLPYATVGYFPIREGSSSRAGRSVAGAQVGVQWEFSERTRFKVGLAQYAFRHFEARVDPDYSAVNGAGPSYGQYEYEAGLRQRGNTLVATNNPAEPFNWDRYRWGLAMKFRPLAVTAAAEFSHFAPIVIGVSAEAVRNQAFDLDEAQARTGFFFNHARSYGVGGRLTVGAQQVRNPGDWQASLGLRWLGSDAVPDAFVDSDLAGGGTNLRGFMLGYQLGLARDTSLGLRYLSGRSISPASTQAGATDHFSFDTWQVDLNVRF